MRGELEALLKKQLAAGSFVVFRGKPVAVGVLSTDLPEQRRSSSKPRPRRSSRNTPKRRFRPRPTRREIPRYVELFAQIATKDDPLGLVKKAAGKASVDTGCYCALVSLRDYLEKHGQVEGRKVLDDFFAAPYGWSKDTTRYLIAALLIAGDVKLRIAGADVTVRGDAATEALKNNNSFNKVGVSVRDSRPSLEAKSRAAEHLLSLTGDKPLPLEDDISKAVIKCFPQLQRNYAALATQLRNLDVPGVYCAEGIQDGITEILRGDASDATSWLGGETCPLADDLEWARRVKKALDNGIDSVVEDLRTWMADITAMPDVGIPGKLIAETPPSCARKPRGF